MAQRESCLTAENKTPAGSGSNSTLMDIAFRSLNSAAMAAGGR
jgi:hypothetical protein